MEKSPENQWISNTFPRDIPYWNEYGLSFAIDKDGNPASAYIDNSYISEHAIGGDYKGANVNNSLGFAKLNGGIWINETINQTQGFNSGASPNFLSPIKLAFNQSNTPHIFYLSQKGIQHAWWTPHTSYPIIENITPSSAPNTTLINFRITGSNFITTPVVNLTRTVSGITNNVTATNVAVPDSNNITGTFDLTTVPEGIYDLQVRNPDGGTATKAEAFGVVPRISVTVTSVDPSTSYNDDVYGFTVRGTGFVPGSNISIAKPGTIIYADTVLYGDSTTLSPVFSLQGVPVGVYNLTVTNPDGEKGTKEGVITISQSPPPPLTAQFIPSVASGQGPLQATFYDQSTGNPTSWFWEFGDGATSADQNPTHTYGTVGYYAVNLTVGNGTTTHTVSHPDYIAVTPDNTGDYLKIQNAVSYAVGKVNTGYSGNSLNFINEAYVNGSGYSFDAPVENFDQLKELVHRVNKNQTLIPPKGSLTLYRSGDMAFALSEGDGNVIGCTNDRIIRRGYNPDPSGYVGWSFPVISAPTVLYPINGSTITGDGVAFNLTYSAWANESVEFDHYNISIEGIDALEQANMLNVMGSGTCSYSTNIRSKNLWWQNTCSDKNLLYRICLQDKSNNIFGNLITGQVQTVQNEWIEVISDTAIIYTDPNGVKPLKQVPKGWVLKYIETTQDGQWYHIDDVSEGLPDEKRVIGYVKKQEIQFISSDNGKTKNVPYYSIPDSSYRLSDDLIVSNKKNYSVFFVQFILFSDMSEAIKNLNDEDLGVSGGLFNLKLETVVKEFQKKYREEILKQPDGSYIEPTGKIGSKTRDKLNTLFADNYQQYKINYLKKYSDRTRSQVISNILTDIINLLNNPTNTQNPYYGKNPKLLNLKNIAYFDKNLLLGKYYSESGGSQFDNTKIGNSFGDWGRGIGQIDSKKWVGIISELKWWNENGVEDSCDCRSCVEPIKTETEQDCKHYYTNTIQGIEGNLFDALYVVNDAYERYCKNIENMPLDNYQTNLRTEDFKQVRAIKRYNGEARYYGYYNEDVCTQCKIGERTITYKRCMPNIAVTFNNEITENRECDMCGCPYGNNNAVEDYLYKLYLNLKSSGFKNTFDLENDYLNSLPLDLLLLKKSDVLFTLTKIDNDYYESHRLQLTTKIGEASKILKYDITCPVDAELLDPSGRYINISYNSIPDAYYMVTNESDSDRRIEIIVFTPIAGNYQLSVFPINKENPIGNYSVTIIQGENTSYNPIILANNVNLSTTPNATYFFTPQLIIPGVPIADFNVNKVVTNPGSPIQFIDNSSGDPENWSWDFGDGNITVDRNPIHTFESPGMYDISLTVSNVNGYDNQYRHNYITVLPLLDHTITVTTSPNGNITPSGLVSVAEGSDQVFTITPNSGYYVENVLIDNSSGGPVSSYLFTNVTTNHTIFANFTSTPGQYQVNASADPWTITYPPGNRTYPGGANATYITQAKPGSDLLNVTVDHQPRGPEPYWTFTNISGGHQISSNGQPTPGQVHALFSLNLSWGKTPLTVAFTNQSLGSPTSWFWEFGDGSSSTEENPEHTYQMPGTYSVTLTGRNDQSSGKAVLHNAITVTSDAVPSPTPTLVPGNITAAFSVDQTTGSVPLQVSFRDRSTGNPTSWFWDLGDGNISTLRNLTHMYLSPGSYSVSLTAQNSISSGSVTENEYITVT